ncbi:MAG: oxidoreductase [Rhodospirillales bacterium]
MAIGPIISWQRFRAALLVIVISLPISLTSITAVDAALARPSGEPLLVVTGKIEQTNVGDAAHLDRQALQAIGMTTLTTSNQFEPGVHTYEGVLLGDLLTYLGADGSKLIATALDGYSVEIPVSDARKFPIILAMIRNGKPMGVRDRGPIWIIYPIDQFNELKDEKYSARSIWQLDRIDVQ